VRTCFHGLKDILDMVSHTLVLLLALQSQISEAGSAKSEKISHHGDTLPLPIDGSDAFKFPGGPKPDAPLITQPLSRTGNTRMNMEAHHNQYPQKTDSHANKEDHSGEAVDLGPPKTDKRMARSGSGKVAMPEMDKTMAPSGTGGMGMEVDYNGKPGSVHVQRDTLARVGGVRSHAPVRVPTRVGHLTRAVVATRAAGVTGPVLAQLEAILATAMSEEVDTDVAEADEDDDEDDENNEGNEDDEDTELDEDKGKDTDTAEAKAGSLMQQISLEAVSQDWSEKFGDGSCSNSVSWLGASGQQKSLQECMDACVAEPGCSFISIGLWDHLGAEKPSGVGSCYMADRCDASSGQPQYKSYELLPPTPAPTRSRR